MIYLIETDYGQKAFIDKLGNFILGFIKIFTRYK
jgi:hypothetical protein